MNLTTELKIIMKEAFKFAFIGMLIFLSIAIPISYISQYLNININIIITIIVITTVILIYYIDDKKLHCNKKITKSLFKIFNIEKRFIC